MLICGKIQFQRDIPMLARSCRCFSHFSACSVLDSFSTPTSSSRWGLNTGRGMDGIDEPRVIPATEMPPGVLAGTARSRQPRPCGPRFRIPYPCAPWHQTRSPRYSNKWSLPGQNCISCGGGGVSSKSRHRHVLFMCFVCFKSLWVYGLLALGDAAPPPRNE